MRYTYNYSKLSSIPANWNFIVACDNRLLSLEYLQALENSLPNNMTIEVICFYKDTQLIGGALLQNLKFDRHNTFQIEGSTLCGVRNRVIRILASNITFLGNNMLTGQNGFHFKNNSIEYKDIINILEKAVAEYCSIHKTKLWVWKDYTTKESEDLSALKNNGYARFEVQPSMELRISPEWKSFDDYYNQMKKKYRARVRTARKKSSTIVHKNLTLEEMKSQETAMNILYKEVAKNADFNTFFLPKNHFYELKKQLKEYFQVMAYYENEELVGFCSFIDNYSELDTYFLGYRSAYQKSHQLYLNMLLDMAAWGIDKQTFKTINYGRTALEIKSSIGAKPVQLYGFIKQRNSIVNKVAKPILDRLSPKFEFEERNPF